MKEQCEFRAIYDMVEYEFVGYEELNNLSDYISDVRWDDKEELWKTGWYYNTNNVYIERWIMGKFNLVKDFIMANNLFDLLTYEIKKLDDYDNYLFIIKPITYDDCFKWIKIFGITYSVLAISCIILFQFINF